MAKMRMKEITAEAFAAVPRVMFIYHHLACMTDTFSIFTEGDQYDDSLMDELLDVEWELIKEFPEAAFNYIPAIGGEIPSGCIRKYARCIYERQVTS